MAASGRRQRVKKEQTKLKKAAKIAANFARVITDAAHEQMASPPDIKFALDLIEHATFRGRIADVVFSREDVGVLKAELSRLAPDLRDAEPLPLGEGDDDADFSHPSDLDCAPEGVEMIRSPRDVQDREDEEEQEEEEEKLLVSVAAGRKR